MHINHVLALRAICTSRLNDLLGVLFAENQQQTGGRIHYVLFNPWAVRSNEALNSFDSPLMKLLARAIYAIVGVSVEEAIAPITHLIDNPPHTALSAFIKTKPVDLTMNTFDRGKAVRLDDITKSC